MITLYFCRSTCGTENTPTSVSMVRPRFLRDVTWWQTSRQGATSLCSYWVRELAVSV